MEHTERPAQFEQRKRDHLKIALDPRAQSSRWTGLEAVELVHEALPELNFQDVSIATEFQGRPLSAPFFISSMTAGHDQGRAVNLELARLSSRRRLLMGVGSQRRELQDREASAEWGILRKEAPGALLAGNIGLAQVIRSTTDDIRRLVDALEAVALFVHLNPLQECVQPEGTPQFRGGLAAISRLARELPVPVILKETGCGMSEKTLQRLEGSGVFAVDVSGLGGTHWGRVEGLRLSVNDYREEASRSFADWGVPTLQSVLAAREARVTYRIWASGGVRTGVDVAKLVALGAEMVGLAQPWLTAFASPPSIGLGVSGGDDVALNLDRVVDRLTLELKTAMFCTGNGTLKELAEGETWTWRKL